MKREEATTTPFLTDRGVVTAGPQKPSPHTVNYAFLHRATVIVRSPAGGGVRMELYQRRAMGTLSLDN